MVAVKEGDTSLVQVLIGSTDIDIQENVSTLLQIPMLSSAYSIFSTPEE